MLFIIPLLFYIQSKYPKVRHCLGCDVSGRVVDLEPGPLVGLESVFELESRSVFLVMLDPDLWVLVRSVLVF